MEELKSFSIIESKTNKRFGSDCVFYRNGVLCFYTDNKGTLKNHFIKQGEYTINPICYPVMDSDYPII